MIAKGPDLGGNAMVPESQIPTYEDLLWPTLKALEKAGGSASIQELSTQVATDMALPDEVLDMLHKDGPQTEVDYRAAWARTHLKKVGTIDNTSRGVWTITDKGRGVGTEEVARELVRNVRAEMYKARRANDAKVPKPDPSREGDDTSDEQDWESELLDILRAMAPDAFERLCQRILRESGFTRVEVTGRSGDGGIDGAGVLRVELISFHVRFQCKRYSGSVAAREIRDFRGAMVGRADKGLFITTGAFTRDAQREAVRDGAPAIDLIDGGELCQLLKKFELGVSTRTVQEVSPQAAFFESL
jgi:restriction system protein